MSSEERRKKEKENRKNSILKAARKLFFERGFKSVTVDLIAAKAEVSKGSIYLYFDSKEEIYTQILISANIERHKEIENFARQEGTASELLLKYARVYVDFFLENNELFRILMTFMLHAENMNLTEEQNTQLIHTTNENIRTVSEILQKGVDTGEFSSQIDIRQGQNAIWGLLNGIISLYIYSGAPEKRSERIHTTIQESLKIFIKGIKSQS
ncbi:MAG: Fatty acid metabolism regulator protein [Deltaproteobacteria bacterium ADurb.Bin151]|nr:TetR/AcrR family transcriptional regulator [Smithella sp.]OQB55381.1 MAG: Fatty acid metabolism regulator protein [Deltaproteobacteria bacterium ADurb.Bin151]HNZ11286.1 TetR/AcrR family transcriptional regulator [Smithellaceae bacterium]HOF42871.1 TetR/AcrR family transcriptional regulator [Candidatus Moranbacteria bacterium]HOG82162.1 TetR/AcrR family transcriptional regulator [Smithellaceae bacterium]